MEHAIESRRPVPFAAIDAQHAPDLELDQLEETVAAMLVEAGEIALRWFRSGLEAEDKGGDRGYDPVTIADRDIERVLRERISAAYPDHEVVGEEAGTSGPPGRYRWLIDPIDGTKAFVTGSPLWGTLLGLLDEGRPVAGWIHQPYLEETFVGIAGRGAWMERRGTRQAAAYSPRRHARRRRRLLHGADDVHRSR